MSAQSRSGLWKDEEGTVFVEALIVLPVLTILGFGLLEFGNVMWEREQLQVGLRDAARYWSRCRANATSFAATCNEDTAREIAFYGRPLTQAERDGDTASPPLRVPGWDDASEISFTPEQALLPAIASLPADPAEMDKVSVSGTVVYEGSPAFAMLLEDAVTISHRVEMRFIGW